MFFATLRSAPLRRQAGRQAEKETLLSEVVIKLIRVK
jgi:hypothetical protein